MYLSDVIALPVYAFPEYHMPVDALLHMFQLYCLLSFHRLHFYLAFGESLTYGHPMLADYVVALTTAQRFFLYLKFD